MVRKGRGDPTAWVRPGAEASALCALALLEWKANLKDFPAWYGLEFESVFITLSPLPSFLLTLYHESLARFGVLSRARFETGQKFSSSRLSGSDV